jgi:PPOX class probable F420-dependent enzyme
VHLTPVGASAGGIGEPERSGMGEPIEGRASDLLKAKNFCHVATIGPDGVPYVVVTWVDIEDGHVLLNAAEGRVWLANLRRDPRVTLTVMNNESPDEYVRIRGRMVAQTHERADEHIARLATKYLGSETRRSPTEGEVRVIFRIEAERVTLVRS